MGWFDEALGGDFDYGSAKTKFRYYWGIGEKWVLGFRYLLARKLGLGVGIDIARGSEDTVGYLTIGSTW